MPDPAPNVIADAGRSLAAVSGRTQWLLWFTVTVGGLTAIGVLYATVTVRTNLLDYMSLAIVSLFLGALVKSFRDIQFLERETRAASHQVAQLVTVNDIAIFLQQSRPSLFRSHIEALHTIFLNDSNISQDNLIEITHARLIARNKVVDLLASILITLGLMGTIIGLLMSVGGLGGVLAADSADTAAVTEKMKLTVQGLGTAFYTTLFGAAFGGVILRILTSVVDANILRYMAHLSELTEIHVLPAMRRMASRLQDTGYYKRLDER